MRGHRLERYLRSFVAKSVVIALIQTTSFPCDAQVLHSEYKGTASWGPNSRGFEMSISSDLIAYAADQPVMITALIRNTGPGIFVNPMEPPAFQAMLTDSHGKAVALKPAWTDELNTTGINGYYLDTNGYVENRLLLADRYDLQPGTYRLTASIDVIRGTSMDPKRTVFAHVTSNTISFSFGIDPTGAYPNEHKCPGHSMSYLPGPSSAPDIPNGPIVDGLALSITRKQTSPSNVWLTAEIRNTTDATKCLFNLQSGFFRFTASALNKRTQEEIVIPNVLVDLGDGPFGTNGRPMTSHSSVFLPVSLDRYLKVTEPGLYSLRLKADLIEVIDEGSERIGFTLVSNPLIVYLEPNRISTAPEAPSVKGSYPGTASYPVERSQVVTAQLSVYYRTISTYLEGEPKIVLLDFSVPKADANLNLACMTPNSDLRIALFNKNGAPVTINPDASDYASRSPLSPIVKGPCEKVLGLRDSYWDVDLEKLFGHLPAGTYLLSIKFVSPRFPGKSVLLPYATFSVVR